LSLEESWNRASLNGIRGGEIRVSSVGRNIVCKGEGGVSFGYFLGGGKVVTNETRSLSQKECQSMVVMLSHHEAEGQNYWVVKKKLGDAI